MRLAERFKDRLRSWLLSGQYADKAEQLRVLAFRGQERIPKAIEIDTDLVAERQDAIVSIGERVLCDAVTSVPLLCMRRRKVGKAWRFDPDDKHPINETLNEPNDMCSLSEIETHIVQSLTLSGNSYLHIDSDGRREAPYLWPLEPQRMSIAVEKSSGKMNGYDYEFDAHVMAYKIDEIIHHRLYSIADAHYGRSRIEPMRAEIMERFFVNRYNTGFFKHGAQVNDVFIPDRALTAPQVDQFKQQIQDRHSGVDAAHRVFVPPVPGTWSKLGMAHKDLAFGEVLRMSRETILGLMGLPPFLAGVMEYANYANAVAQDKTFWRHTILPLLALIADNLNRQLMWRYFNDRDHILQFDIDGVEALQDDRLVTAQVQDIYVRSGVKTVDEVRAELGMDPLPLVKPLPDKKELELDEQKQKTEDAKADALSAADRLKQSLARMTDIPNRRLVTFVDPIYAGQLTRGMTGGADDKNNGDGRYRKKYF